jgi:hypothetical protein
MSPPSPDAEDHSDSFRLHYVEERRRCVITYDTLDAALEGARTRLAKHPDLRLWISDAGKQVLMDGAAIRARLAADSPDSPGGE